MAAPRDEQTAVSWDDSTAAPMAVGKDKQRAELRAAQRAGSLVAAKGALQAAKWAGSTGELTVASKAAWLVDVTDGCWAELTGTRWAVRTDWC